jgi:hypothetical protein
MVKNQLVLNQRSIDLNRTNKFVNNIIFKHNERWNWNWLIPIFKLI